MTNKLKELTFNLKIQQKEYSSASLTGNGFSKFYYDKNGGMKWNYNSFSVLCIQCA